MKSGLFLSKNFTQPHTIFSFPHQELVGVVIDIVCYILGRLNIKGANMSNRCGFCEVKTDTNTLVLGDQWLEFCTPCGDTETLTHGDTGEVASIKAVFDHSVDGTPVITRPAPVIEGVFLNGQPLTETMAVSMHYAEY